MERSTSFTISASDFGAFSRTKAMARPWVQAGRYGKFKKDEKTFLNVRWMCYGGNSPYVHLQSKKESRLGSIRP